MWWTESLGRIELNITKAQARRGYHHGACDADIAQLVKEPAIRRQLAKLDRAVVREALRETGGWNAQELADDTLNLERLLWIACGDIVETLNQGE